MSSRIGILGGVSPASTAEYYRSLIRMYHERMHDYHFPEIIIKSLDFAYFTSLEEPGREAEYVSYLIDGIESLRLAGADFALMACNSAHSAFDEVSKASKIPMLSIVDAVAEEAQRRGYENLLLTGIKHTMRSSFYQEGFARRSMSVKVPSESHQDEIDRIIFDELSLEDFKEASRDWFGRMCRTYEADCVILGCTELPLLVNAASVGKPCLNTLGIHASAALDLCLG